MRPIIFACVFALVVGCSSVPPTGEAVLTISGLRGAPSGTVQASVLQFQCLYGHVPANPSASFLREVTVTGSSDDGRRWTLYFKDEDGPATDQPSEMTVSTPTDAFNTATYVWFPGIMPERYPGGVTWTTDFLGIDIVNAQLDQFDKGSDGLFVSGTVTCP